MARRVTNISERLFHRQALRRWQQTARKAEGLDLATLRVLRGRARQLRQHLDRVLHIADGRLTLPLIGSNAIQKPLYSDWAYRPQLWRGPLNPPGMAAVETKAQFGDEVTVFHDCRISELTVRQIRNTRESDLAPFGLRMDMFRFDGSFLSLVIELPPSAVDGLKRNHLVRMTAVVELEKPIEIFARLNVQHGPNTEQIVRELPLGEDEVVVEFDLAYTKMNEKRVDRIWADLVFENPEMSQVTLRDVNFSRRPRAEV
ncbi:DUF6478 family protein [uncultured Aliiroseovarius sp.]|uniref:DUF6478 family protein n=1 Tax=uncultured Aliiroseovarius sp. TaxID=1658783 RepID=UPI0026294E6B|nr:DUF6478 family protein [uncultured Aliiroseovarius sp.]